MVSKTECRVHHKLEATADAILVRKSPLVEIRHMSLKPIDFDDIPIKHIKEELLTLSNKGMVVMHYDDRIIKCHV